MEFGFSRRFADREFDPNPLTQAQSEIATAVSQGQAQPWLDLTISQPERAGLAASGQWLRHLEEGGRLPYAAEAQGCAAGRAALSAWAAGEGRHTSPEDFTLTSGTSEAYGLLFKLLTDPGESLLLTLPSYPLIDGLAAWEGLDWVAAHLRPRRPASAPAFTVEPTAWDLPVAEVERAWDEACERSGRPPKALILVQPNNPTGSGFAPENAQAIEAFCVQRGLVLILDEVFSPYRHRSDGLSASPFSFRHPEGKRFRLNGLSKMLGLPQAKLGWIEVEGPSAWRAAVRERLSLLADSYLSVGGPVQAALPALLADAPAYQAPIGERLRRNLETFLAGAAARPSLRAWVPEGGWNLPLIVDTHLDDEEAAIDVLRSRGVLVQPGYFYGFDEAECDMEGSATLVVSLLTPPEIFREGLDRLQSWADERG